jgi:hypothetical protein
MCSDAETAAIDGRLDCLCSNLIRLYKLIETYKIAKIHLSNTLFDYFSLIRTHTIPSESMMWQSLGFGANFDWP